MKKTVLFLLLVVSGYTASSGNFDDPPGFIPNKGQIADKNGNLHPEVQYKLEQPDVNAYFMPDGIMYHFYNVQAKSKAEYTKEDQENYAKGDLNAIGKKLYFFRLDLQLLNANKNATSLAEKEGTMERNYYLGHCPQGILGVKSFGEILYKDVYPGIDIRYYFKEGKLKYEFIVHPGADISKISFLYKGASSTTVEDGRLKVSSSYNTIVEDEPYTYYKEDGGEIKSKFEVKEGVVSFTVKSYDHSKTLVIDPTVSWASYYSNAYSSDFHANSAFDSNGNIYTAYATYGGTWPMINAGGGQYYDAVRDGSTDLVIARFNANYSKQWATYYGGDGSDYLCGTGGDYGKTLGVDASNAVYFGGYTNGSTVFPTLSSGVGGAFYQNQTKLYGGDTPFLVKLDANGVRQWATLFQHEQANTSSAGIKINGICVNGSKVYFTGETYRFSNNDVPLRTLAGAYNNATFLGAQDPFIGRFNSNCILEWCTYFNSGIAGQQAYKQGSDITVDASGNLIYAGQASSGSATSGYLLNPGGGAYYSGTFAGSYDVHIAKFNTSMQPVWATYYGSTDLDRISEVSTDASGNILIACRTIGGPGMPTVNPGGAFYYATKQSPGTWSSPGSQDGGIMKFSPAGALTWATYVGGTNNNTSSITGITSDNAGNIYAIGYTNTSNFPVINLAGSYNQASSAGNMDLTLMKFTSGGVGSWSTYYGGAGSDNCYGVKINPSSLANGCGFKQFNSFTTASATLPTVNPGGSAMYESTPATANSNAVLLIEEASAAGNSAASTGATTSTASICTGGSATLTVTGGSLGSGAAWQWYTTSCGGTAAGTGTTITVSPSSATTYYVRAEGTCNTTACSSITVNSNVSSVIPTSITTTTASLCSGGSATLTINGGSLGTAANWQWYTGSCGGTAAGSGASIVVSPGSTTTYYARAEGTCGNTGCVSTAITVNSISSAPTSITTVSSTICAGSTATLTVNGGSLGSGAAWQWFTGSCAGTAAGTGSSITVSPASATTYFVKGVGACNATACSSITINTNSNSTAATSVNTTTASLCSGGSATLSANGGSLGTAANWQWYSGSCGGTPVGSGASISVSPTSTTAYYLRAEGSCGNTGCVSTTINVNSVSANPTSATASSATVCSGSTTTLTVNGGSLGTGAAWQWFTGSCTGTAAGTGSSITVSPASATAYFVKAVGSCNTSLCSSVTVNVNVVSTAPASANPSAGAICSGNSTTLTVSGGSLGTGATWQWYANGCGSSAAGTGTSVVVSPAITTAYFVRAEDLCGNSVCAQVTVTVTATPSAAWISPGTVCSGTGNVNLSALVTGNTGGAWTGTGVSGTNFDPSALTGQTIPVTYSVTNGSCSASITHSISVAGSVSAAWTSPGTLCASNGTVNLNTYITGSSGGSWTGSGVSGTTFDPSALSGNIAITYSIGSGACSDAKTFTITVSPAAVANWTSPGTLCASGGTINLNTYLSGTGGGTWTGTGVSGNTFDPSALAGQTILIGYQVGTNPCIASQSHTIQVVNVANASFTVPAIVCENTTALNLTTLVTGNSGGVFSGTGVTANMFNPSGLAGQSIVITYLVGTNPCSATQTRTITISAAPIAPSVAVSNSVICAGQTTTVTANGSGTGAVYTVYSSPGATGALGTTPLALSPAANTTYYLQSVANGCSNTGGDVPFTINVNPLPIVDAGLNQSLCVGSGLTLTASGGGSYLWNTGATTNSIAVTPTVNTTYTVTVTNANGCSASDVVTITMISGGNVQATDDAGTVQNNTSVTVGVAANDTGDPNTVAVISGPYHGTATIGTNGSIIYTPSNTFEGMDTVYYRICDANCSMMCREAKLLITVTKETIIKVPGGFSPNGDGNNDVFVIKGLEFYPDNELVIFNRWGDEIYKAAPYKNDWSGQSQGKGLTLYGNELVEGTYFYILTLDKNTPPMKGYVELKRK
jgi:gliding motility-associated-like protein